MFVVHLHGCCAELSQGASFLLLHALAALITASSLKKLCNDALRAKLNGRLFILYNL